MNFTIADFQAVHSAVHYNTSETLILGTTFVARMEGSDETAPFDLDPDYQRGHVWTPEQQSAFVGHMIEGGKVPDVICNRIMGGPRGWRDGVGGSTWAHILTEERPDESIDVFGRRALYTLEGLFGRPRGRTGVRTAPMSMLPIVDVDYVGWTTGTAPYSVFRCLSSTPDRRRKGSNRQRVAGPFATRAEAEDEADRLAPDLTGVQWQWRSNLGLELEEETPDA